jgi:translation initiation factor 2 gamma subunit (eIF-2gamma)
MTGRKTMRHKAGMVRNGTVKLGCAPGNVYRCINPSCPRAQSIGLVVASKAYQKKITFTNEIDVIQSTSSERRVSFID